MEKICKKCLISKDVSLFETKKQYNKGYSGYYTTRGTCRKCMNDIYDRSWKERNRESYNKMQRKYSRERTKNLSDIYVKHILQLPFHICTPELIELKRKQLKLFRNVKKIKTKRNKELQS